MYIDKNILIDYYYNKNLSSNEIAKKLGYSGRWVLKSMIHHNLRRRNRSESLKNKSKDFHKDGCLCMACRMKRGELSGENNPMWNCYGESNPNWNGGTTKINKLIRNSKQYTKWRDSVYKRDNYTCQNCGARCGNGKRINLNAHHIKEFSKYPLLIFDIDNGITLCENCHREVHNLV